MQIENLICSGIRQEILRGLLDGPPRALSDLVSERRRQNINTALQPLLDEELVTRENGIYSLTDVGRCYALVLRTISRSASVLQDHFWKSHDLGLIPDFLLQRISDLAGGHVVYPDGDFAAAQKNFSDALKNAKIIYGASSVFVQGWPEAIVEALEAGAGVDLIFTPYVYVKVKASVLGSYTGHPRFKCVVRDFHAAFTIADDTLYLGLFVRGGGADLIREYVCSGEKAVAWGMDLYNYYLNRHQ